MYFVTQLIPEIRKEKLGRFSGHMNVFNCHADVKKMLVANPECEPSIRSVGGLGLA